MEWAAVVLMRPHDSEWRGVRAAPGVAGDTRGQALPHPDFRLWASRILRLSSCRVRPAGLWCFVDAAPPAIVRLCLLCPFHTGCRLLFVLGFLLSCLI